MGFVVSSHRMSPPVGTTAGLGPFGVPRRRAMAIRPRTTSADICPRPLTPLSGWLVKTSPRFVTLTVMSGPARPESARGGAGQIGQVGQIGLGPDRDELCELVRRLAVVHGNVTLSSGKQADHYVDLRRVTLHHRAAALIGRLMRELTGDWDYASVGGLTLGADPVATAIMHAPGRPIDAFVVRKSVKAHGMQRLIEGPDVSGRRVLVVEDTSTTGSSVLTAVRAVRAAGAEVVGVATVVDRATGAAEAIEAEGLPYRSVLGLADLGLDGG